MIAALDVDYRGPIGPAVAAAGLFNAWADEVLDSVVTATLAEVAAYEPGAFFRRELPCLCAALAQVSAPLAVVIIDGHVWLDGVQTPGLGARLYDELGGVPVVGVAKGSFGDGGGAVPVLRGESRVPLHVSAIGLDVARAALLVGSMAGKHRMPTLLKLVDRACRDASL